MSTLEVKPQVSIKIGNTKQLAIINKEDLNEINKYYWYLSSGRIVAWINGKEKSLGSFILNINTNHYIMIDHKDLNIFNNSKSNLRIATKSQNQANHKISIKNTSGYKGVTYDKRRGQWQARITYKGRMRHIRLFYLREDAARAYNKEAIKLFGEFALLNILPK